MRLEKVIDARWDFEMSELYEQLDEFDKNDIAKMIAKDSIEYLISDDYSPEQIVQQLKKSFLQHDIDRIIDGLKS